MSRNHTVVVQYVRDEKTDMFQIGRSSENAIDFIVLDTVVSNLQNSSPISSLISNNQNKHSSQQKNSQSEQNILNNNNNNNQQSTISRFSCRICVEREYPYTARIYAAGFDSSNSIFLGVNY
jgi:pellino protein